MHSIKITHQSTKMSAQDCFMQCCLNRGSFHELQSIFMAEYYAGIKNTNIYLYILTQEDVQEVLISEKSMFKNLIVVHVCVKVTYVILICKQRITSGRTKNKMKLLAGKREIIRNAFPFCLSIFSINTVKNEAFKITTAMRNAEKILHL